MTDLKDLELKKELEKIDWPIEYGSIKIQIRQGKPSLITIERTVRFDFHDMPTPPPESKRPSTV